MDRDSRTAECEEDRDELAEGVAAQTDCAANPALVRLLYDRRVLSSLPDIIALLDREHRIQYINRVVPGRTVAELIGASVLDYLSADERELRREALERAWNTGEIQTIESQSIGGYWWDNRLVPIKEEGRTVYLLTTAVDFTQRKCAEDALRESEARLRHAIEATGMGTWSSDRAGSNITWDESLCRIYGIAPADAPTDYQAIIRYIHPEDREHFMASMRAFEDSGRLEDLEFRIIRGDGAVRHLLSKGSVSLDSSGRAVGSIGGVFDVTDRKNLEEQLLQVQKMDAIGQLTAGIAHNFNNILSVILPNVELCRLGAPSYLASRLDDIAHAAERGAEMVRQLMIFARRETSARKQPIDLGESVRRTAEICRTTFNRRITVDVSVASGLPCALANAGQIEQILLNICLNARDAFEEGQTAEPRIELSADCAASGDALHIRVSDNGPGMDEATRSRIFDPFFTTKTVDRGTGLGLASAYAIVADHRGRITCQSRPGEGAIFQIEIPTTDQRPVSSFPEEFSPRSSSLETLLLIDDDPLVRGAVRSLLELGGYRVLEAGDGLSAIDTFERERSVIAAVILDCLMPGLSGEQVLMRLNELEPDVPVVLLSGHPAHLRVERAAAVLAKPTSADTLLRTLREVIARRSYDSR